MPLLCRVAENMFWLSRHVERAITVIRVVDVTAHLELDSGDREATEADYWIPLLGPTVPLPPLEERAALRLPSPGDIRYYLAFDEDNPSSLVSCVRRARSAAREVRDSISSEMWEQINTTYLSLSDPRTAREVEDNLHGFYRRVRDSLVLIQGLADATVAHDEAWHFLTLGTFLERADNVSRVLNIQGHLLAGAPAPIFGDETMRWLAVLRSAGSAEAYARYYSLRVEPPRVIEFLLLNPSFPQSVRFSLGSAWSAMGAIARACGADDISSSPPARALGLLRARLEHSSVDEIIEQGLPEFLATVQEGISVVSDRITRAYFRHDPLAGRHMAVARAAQLMAAQQ